MTLVVLSTLFRGSGCLSIILRSGVCGRVSNLSAKSSALHDKWVSICDSFCIKASFIAISGLRGMNLMGLSIIFVKKNVAYHTFHFPAVIGGRVRFILCPVVIISGRGSCRGGR